MSENREFDRYTREAKEVIADNQDLIKKMKDLRAGRYAICQTVYSLMREDYGYYQRRIGRAAMEGNILGLERDFGSCKYAKETLDEELRVLKEKLNYLDRDVADYLINCAERKQQGRLRKAYYSQASYAMSNYVRTLIYQI